jgi:hypothetical protein
LSTTSAKQLAVIDAGGQTNDGRGMTSKDGERLSLDTQAFGTSVGGTLVNSLCTGMLKKLFGTKFDEWSEEHPGEMYDLINNRFEYLKKVVAKGDDSYYLQLPHSLILHCAKPTSAPTTAGGATCEPIMPWRFDEAAEMVSRAKISCVSQFLANSRVECLASECVRIPNPEHTTLAPQVTRLQEELDDLKKKKLCPPDTTSVSTTIGVVDEKNDGKEEKKKKSGDDLASPLDATVPDEEKKKQQHGDSKEEKQKKKLPTLVDASSSIIHSWNAKRQHQQSSDEWKQNKLRRCTSSSSGNRKDEEAGESPLVRLDLTTELLEIPAGVIHGMCDMLFNKVFEIIVDVTKSMPDCNTIIMTGGVSESLYFRELCDEFGDMVHTMTGRRFTFLSPQNASFAVLYGCLWYTKAHFTIVEARKCDWIGTNICVDWDDALHKGMEDRLTTVIRNGRKVKAFEGKWVTAITGGDAAYLPGFQTQQIRLPACDMANGMWVEFFTFRSNKKIYGDVPPYSVDGPGSIYLTRLVIPVTPKAMRSYSDNGSCEVRVSMRANEIEIELVNCYSGSSKKATLDWGSSRYGTVTARDPASPTKKKKTAVV